MESIEKVESAQIYNCLITHTNQTPTSQKNGLNITLFTPQPLMALGVLFLPMSGWAGGGSGGQLEEVCPACISETVRCRKLIFGRDIG